MSFLDDLKRQAETLRDQQSTDESALQRRFDATEEACRAALAYLNALADQLQVLQPASRARYALDRQHAFTGLRMTDFYADGRRTRLGKADGFEYLLLHWQLKSGRTLTLVKDFPPDIERLEGRLQQAAVPMEREVVRHPDTGKLVEMRYTVQADFRASVRLTPRHDTATVQVSAQNIDELEGLSFDLPAQALDAARLDELARWLVGQPHRFLDGARNLRRTPC